MEETQYTQYPAQPESQPVYAPVSQPEPQPKKNKLGLILAIGIPVLVVLIVVGIIAGISISKKNQYEEALELLDDGDIAEAIEIHQKLGDYENLEKKICEAAEDECQSLLKKNAYSKVEKLYTAVAGYPEAVKGMDKKLKKHINSLLDDYDFEGAVDAYDNLKGNEAASKLVAGEIGDYASELWRDDFYAFVNLIEFLKNEQLQLDAVDTATVEFIRYLIDAQDYYTAVNLATFLEEGGDHRSNVCKALAEDMGQNLQNESYYVFDMMDALNYYGLIAEEVYQVVYDYSCGLMDQGKYKLARDYLGLIMDYKDSADKHTEAEVGVAKEDLIYYLENEWFWDARYLVDSYEGQIHEELVAIFLQYSADNSFLADLEAALLSRIEYAGQGAEYYDAAKHEWDLISKYEYMTFYDEHLQELAMDYLNALSNQMYYAEWYAEDYYELYYYWLTYAGDRYIALTKLHNEYGFNPQNEDIQKMFGSGEQVRNYANAWHVIHADLQWQLWGTYANEDSQGYYLQYTNYTEYTFDLYVWNYFEDYDGVTIESVDPVFEGVQPGETVKIYFSFPEDTYDYYWYVDWDMIHIYQNGQLLDPEL